MCWHSRVLHEVLSIGKRAQVFSQLDDKLQQGFVDYLAERGVTAELGRYIIEYSADKEQREYMHWLEGVHTFLKA